MGLVAATKLAAHLELCDPELVYRVEVLLRQLHLPTMYDEFEAEQVLAMMTTDKKKSQGKIRFVLPEALGRVVIRGDVAREDVAAVLEEGKGDEGK
jgi:3-dehydroquinate synthase